MVCSDTQCCSVVEFVNPSTPASKSLLTTNFFRYDLFPKLNQKEKKTTVYWIPTQVSWESING